MGADAELTQHTGAREGHYSRGKAGGSSELSFPLSCITTDTHTRAHKHTDTQTMVMGSLASPDEARPLSKTAGSPFKPKKVPQ